ncbi:ATP synthase subunit d, mitochondrial [Sesamum alatum]|uniref:ATP synthase subunit d, mitochondrial n=1 Tax=Sesamum alatum TaxID=300844 RepID=A0AAE1XRP0_9LAMI|nr:ATP synthase subunit d, mitochondrial [Sesamum alatum]
MFGRVSDEYTIYIRIKANTHNPPTHIAAFCSHTNSRTVLHSVCRPIDQSINQSKRRKMSGAGKKVVDVAFKAGRNIDWEGMAKLLVSEEARREFATLRRAFDEVNTQLQTKFSQEPEPIDWEYYRKGIGSRLVDMYKQAYDEVKIPQYVDNVTPQYKPKFDALLVELKEAEEKSLKESERLEKEIADVQELKRKLSTMTADEYFEKHPELKKKFDDEIRNDYWGY